MLFRYQPSVSVWWKMRNLELSKVRVFQTAEYECAAVVIDPLICNSSGISHRIINCNAI